MRRLVLAAASVVIVVGLAGCAGAPVEAQNAAPEPASTPNGRTVEDAPAKVFVPDVRGMTPEAAAAELKAVGLDAVTAGEGTAVMTQFPAPGTSVDPGTMVELTLTTPDPEGTRNDPFPFGSTLVGSGAGNVEEVLIDLGTAQWGAGDIVMAENRFNDPAPDGSVYVLLPVTITNVGSDEPITPWLDVDIIYVAPDGRSYEQEWASIPNDLADIGDLYEGGSATGNLAFILPIDSQGGVWGVSYGWSDPVFVAAG